jgi:hypothetical protein
VAVVTRLGAWLLFPVQPLFGRAILPWFGGARGVSAAGGSETSRAVLVTDRESSLWEILR